MQKPFSILIMLITLVIIQSCMFDTSEKVSGNGKVVKQERTIAAFNTIDASGVFNIYLSQGDKESLTIEADENLIPYIETNVEGNTLHIDMKEHMNIRNAKKKNIHLTIKDVNRLKINSVGNIETSGQLHLKDLNMEHSGVGNLKLDFECNKFVANIHSVGQVTLKGKVAKAEISNSSVGNTNASELIADTLNLENSSVGNVEVHATKEISINSSGIGNVNFGGGAVVKNLSSSGIGKVSKKND